MKTDPLIVRPKVTDVLDILPSEKKPHSDKSLSEIIETIGEYLKPYRSNMTIEIDMLDKKPKIIRLNYEIFT
jgi:hypothetical protein